MSAYSDKVIADGAVAYWRLNETSGTTAVDSIGGNNGTISGSVTLNQPGGTSDGDRAMQFNSTGSVITVSSAGFMNTPQITVEAWARARTGAATSLSVMSKSIGQA